MAVATYTKAGAKASTPAKLDKAVFGVETSDHQLLKDAYLAHQADRRTNNAKTKKRGEVRGGGRKPWRQKGTGNARVGSIRTPLWRGGGVIFGPTGSENYTRRLSSAAKQQALRQALSLAATEDRIAVIDSLSLDGKTKSAAALLKKLGQTDRVLLVCDSIDEKTARAVKNLPGVRLTTSAYLNTAAVLNASYLVIVKPALEHLSKRLGAAK